MQFREHCATSVKQCSLGVSHKSYFFVTFRTLIDADFQCRSNGSIFIGNGYK